MKFRIFLTIAIGLKVSLLSYFAIRSGVIKLGEPLLLGEDKPPEENGAVDAATKDKENKEVPVTQADELDQFQKLLTDPEYTKEDVPFEQSIKNLQKVKEVLAVLELKLAGIKENRKAMETLATDLDAKRKLIKEEVEFFKKTLQDEKVLKEERLKELVDFYAKMEPKKAAPLLATMDRDLVIGVFKKLKQKTVTAILEAMTPDKAAKLSEYYARNGSAREYEQLTDINDALRKEFAPCEPAVAPEPAAPVTPAAPAANPAPATPAPAAPPSPAKV